jgi:hypothetical protein
VIAGHCKILGADAVYHGKTNHQDPMLGESVGMAAEVAHISRADLPSTTLDHPRSTRSPLNVASPVQRQPSLA